MLRLLKIGEVILLCLIIATRPIDGQDDSIDVTYFAEIVGHPLAKNVQSQLSSDVFTSLVIKIHENAIKDLDVDTRLYLKIQENNELKKELETKEQLLASANSALAQVEDDYDKTEKDKEKAEHDYSICTREKVECIDIAREKEDTLKACEQNNKDCFDENKNLQKEVDYMKLLLHAVEPDNVISYIDTLNKEKEYLLLDNMNKTTQISERDYIILGLNNQIQELDSSLASKDQQYLSCAHEVEDLKCTLQKCIVLEQESKQTILDYELKDEERKKVQENRENSAENAMMEALKISKIFQLKYAAGDDVHQTLITMANMLKVAEPMIYWPFYSAGTPKLMMLAIAQFELAVSSYFCGLSEMECNYGTICDILPPQELFSPADIEEKITYLQNTLQISIVSANISTGFAGYSQVIRSQLLELTSTIFPSPGLVNNLDDYIFYFTIIHETEIGIPLFAPEQLALLDKVEYVLEADDPITLKERASENIGCRCSYEDSSCFVDVN